MRIPHQDSITSPMTTKDKRQPSVRALQRRPALRRPHYTRKKESGRHSHGITDVIRVDDGSLGKEEEKQCCSDDDTTGSSLELAPSLINIYDNLAGLTDDATNTCLFEHDQQQYKSRSLHGIWVTDRDTSQRFLLQCPPGFSGRPVSLMEPETDSTFEVEKEAKKRPLSISSSSSVSTTSLPRLQSKRPNLERDAEDGSDVTSHTSSDSGLANSFSDTTSLLSTDSVTGDVVPFVVGRGDVRLPERGRADSGTLHNHCPPDPCFGKSNNMETHAPASGAVVGVDVSPRVQSQINVNNESAPLEEVETSPSTPTSSRAMTNKIEFCGKGAIIPPVVMTPLQTTKRPVLINVPAVIRRHSNSSITTHAKNGSGDGGGATALEISSRNCPEPRSLNPKRFSDVPPSTRNLEQKIAVPSATGGVAVLDGLLSTTPVQPRLSPFTPTAEARRKFLASHFDIPYIPAAAEIPNATEKPESQSEQGCSTVPASDENVSRTDSSVTGVVMSCTSAPSAPATEIVSNIGLQAGSTPSRGDAVPEEAPTPRSEGTGVQPMDTHTPEMVRPSLPEPAATTPPLSRGRSHKGGTSSGGRGNSVKGGGSQTYVSYVQRVVTEIVETERMYVESLQAIIQGYMEPLEKLNNAKVRSEKLVCLFCNIRDIYAFGKIFLADLEQCGLDPLKLAECFVKHNKGFVIYTDYCTNYPRAVEVLTQFMQDSELSEVCKNCQLSLGHGLPLGAYLLRPVQRILKYHLLLQNILKNFDKAKPGYPVLEQALQHMTAMAHHINEMKRRHEHAVRIQEVQSQLEDYNGEDLTRLGDLVLEGSFRVYGAKASRQVFLFEKGILISKKKEGGMLTCKVFIPCSNLMLVEVISNEPLNFHIIPFDNPRAQHTLQARNIEQKRLWCQEIKRLILESYKGRIPDNVKNLVMELGSNNDTESAGKDFFDSPWKHQHTAPEYLEKRRIRKKSGGKLSDAMLLKPQKGGGKREQGITKNKSPKASRKSDSKLLSTRPDALPVMLANASSASLPGIQMPVSLKSPSSSHQWSEENMQENAERMSESGRKSSSTITASSPNSSAESPSEHTLSESKSDFAVQRRRQKSFKRAVRTQPVSSQDLTHVVPVVVSPPTEIYNPDRMEDSYIIHSDLENDVCLSSPSESENSSDSDSDENQSQEEGSKKAMYSSMPALNRLERRPAQKIKGRTKHLTADLKKTDISKSSDGLIADDDKNGETMNSVSSPTAVSAHHFRRRWEGTDDGMQAKVPALHDVYGRRSREILLRRRGLYLGDKPKADQSKAKLTNWSSVDKLIHGSMTDLSHVNEDPWVRNTESPPAEVRHEALNNAKNVKLRSSSLSSAQRRDWNPAVLDTNGHQRKSSDVIELRRSGGKENMDWMVYLNRNSSDPILRERANSLSKLNQPSPLAGEVKPKNMLHESVKGTNPEVLCREIVQKYSQECSDDQNEKSPVEISKSEDSDKPVNQQICSAVLNTTNSTDNHLPSVDVLNSRTDQPGCDSNLPVFSGHQNVPSTAQCQRSLSHKELSSSLKSPQVPLSQQVFQFPPTESLSSKSDRQPLSPKWSTQNSSPMIGGGHMISQDREQPMSQGQISAPLSPKSAALAAESNRIVAEMEKYCESNLSQTPTLPSKFPFLTELSPSQSCPHPLLSCEELHSNRLSGISSLSSSSNDGSSTSRQFHTWHDPNPNRLSGVSSLSTSSHDSQNSVSSDSLVGTLKNKLNVLTHKLGGRKSRDEELGLGLSASRDSIATPKSNDKAELYDVLREHALGSRMIGSRMANTLPVGLEPILSPTNKKASKECGDLVNKEACLPSEKEPPKTILQNVSQSHHTLGGLSIYWDDSREIVHRIDQDHVDSATSVHPNMDAEESVSMRRRHNSNSSGNSVDSFYERRLSIAFESDIFHEPLNANGHMDSAQGEKDGAVIPRKSIREVVQYIEERFKPHNPRPVEVRRREPSALIRQRLKSLHENASYKTRTSIRSVSEDRAGARATSPPFFVPSSPRLPRAGHTSFGNQFVHRVTSEPLSSTSITLERERGREVQRGRREREKGRDLERVKRENECGRSSEEHKDTGSATVARVGSMNKLDQLSNDPDNIVFMRGWVRSLINKFQQRT